MRVAIIGSRDYPNLEVVRSYVASLLSEGDVVVSGGARGVDKAAEEAAKARGLKVVSIRPQWGKFGRAAGFRRNSDIVAQCDRLVAFWDGKSRGTQDSIRKAKAAGKEVQVVLPPIRLRKEDLEQRPPKYKGLKCGVCGKAAFYFLPERRWARCEEHKQVLGGEK